MVIPAKFETSATFETEIGEIQRLATSDHSQLTNRDLPDQHPMGAITGLTEALQNAGTSYEIGHGLKLEGSTLSVNTAGTVEQDNTLPITAAAVYTTVGNIEILLQTI